MVLSIKWERQNGSLFGAMPMVLLELIEARQSEQGVAQDQHAPRFADPLQAASDRAVHVARAFAAHRSRPTDVHVARTSDK